VRAELDEVAAIGSLEGLEQRLRGHVETLATAIGERHYKRPDALAAARGYVRRQLEAAGYEVASLWYEARKVQVANLECTIPGTSRPERILLIGAHYDTAFGTPGANDNASAVAGLLEIARALRGIEPAITVRFVAFTNEEPPFFMTRKQGSAVYARAARERGDDIRVMACLEMIGSYSDEPGSQRYPPVFRYFYPDRGNFIGFVSDLRSRQVTREIEQAFRRHTDFPIERTATFRFVPGVALSDHWPFWRQGYRAFMITDTAFYRYPYYHTPHDTPDKLNFPEFARMTEGLIRAFADVAIEGL
jgi:Zn-dependent M28 family amino/carboxypeptidase